MRVQVCFGIERCQHGEDAMNAAVVLVEQGGMRAQRFHALVHH